MNEDEQIITTHVGCTIADVFGEFNFRKAADTIEAVNTYIEALFPTTTKYGGVYSCSFDEFFESIERDENRFEDFHMHKAIESYAEHFPNNPIYKQALKEFD